MLKLLLQLFFLWRLNGDAPNPHHCLDFASSPVLDTCGDIEFALPCEMPVINSARTKKSDSSYAGLNEEVDYFFSQIPNQMNTTWTVGMWVRLLFNGGV